MDQAFERKGPQQRAQGADALLACLMTFLPRFKLATHHAHVLALAQNVGPPGFGQAHALIVVGRIGIAHVVVEGQKEGQPRLGCLFKIQQPVPRERFLKPQQADFARGIEWQHGRNSLKHAKLVKPQDAGRRVVLIADVLKFVEQPKARDDIHSLGLRAFLMKLFRSAPMWVIALLKAHSLRQRRGVFHKTQGMGT